MFTRYKMITFVALMALMLGNGSMASAGGTELNASWDKGVRFATEDGSVKLKLGGRIMHDWTTWLSPDEELEAAVGELETGSEFRRARLYVAGKIHGKLEFKAQYDFAGGDADFKDMYLGLTKLPVVGGLRVGHFKEPFGLEELTSSKYITFMERSLTATFAPSRNNGVMLHNKACNENLTWAVGFFRDADGFGEENGDDNAFAYTGRITGVPWQNEDLSSLVHVGASVSYRNIDDSETRYRQRPEVHNSPRFVDTETIAADSATHVGAELALVLQSLAVQAEYAQAFLDSAEGSSDDPSFPSWYIQVSYFLTGEHRQYKKSKGAFARVKVQEPYIAEESGPGAFEVAARYSWIDLDDGAVAGGELSDVTVGLNWYLHSNTRVMLNWVHADLDSVGKTDVLQSRFQVDF